MEGPPSGSGAVLDFLKAYADSSDGSTGIRRTSLRRDSHARGLGRAVALNERGIKAPARPRSKGNRRRKVPDYFAGALRRNRKALATFERFSTTNKKVRNWKYIKEVKAVVVGFTHASNG